MTEITPEAIESALHRLRDSQVPYDDGDRVVVDFHALCDVLWLVPDALSRPPLTEATDEGDVERVARAIEGPHLPVPEGCRFTLDELREVRWNNLTDQEQGARRSEARAAIATLRASRSSDGSGTFEDGIKAAAKAAEATFDWGPGEAPRTYRALARRIAKSIRSLSPQSGWADVGPGLVEALRGCVEFHGDDEAPEEDWSHIKHARAALAAARALTGKGER